MRLCRHPYGFHNKPDLIFICYIRLERTTFIMAHLNADPIRLNVVLESSFFPLTFRHRMLLNTLGRRRVDH